MHRWLSTWLSLILAATAWGDDLKEPALTPKDRAHRAFQPPRRSAPPGQWTAWERNVIDGFVLAELQAVGLAPSPEADRATLLRRVTFDLTGLPPTPAELQAFLADPRPDAYECVVERLLASPQHGERWAQHWLDVVRYAESNGYEADGDRPDAWRYRDYVVRSFNSDLPFDRFVTEQLAGDLLARGQDARQAADLLIAAGFQRCGPVHLVGGNTDPEINRQEVLTEMTSAVGSAILGLTVGCARCHNHKFDPVSQADYYRLQALFAATQPKEIDVSTPQERAAHEQVVAGLKVQIEPLQKQVAEIEAPCRAKLQEAKKAALEPAYRDALAVDAKQRTPEQKRLAEHAEILLKITWDEVVAALTPADRDRRAVLRARIHALEARMPPPLAHAWTVSDVEPAPPTHLLKRGDPKRKGPVVSPGAPRVLLQIENQQSKIENRLDLARWLTRPDHPLTARVMVNRLWQYHFGRGLVSTPNDFGLRGQPPTHPELLDWLAVEFVEHGWSLKHLHRLMVLSATYRQASRQAAVGRRQQEVDPENRLIWRMNRRRLEGEALRDFALAAAGTLNPKLGGPMIRVPLEPEVYELIFTEGEPDGLWPVTPDVREHARRSLYLFVKRNVRLPLFEAMDKPDTLTSCAIRPVSTFAPQALILLNGPFMQEQSKAFAARLIRDCGEDMTRQVERAHQLALGRLPTDAETRKAIGFLEVQAELLRDRLRARRRVELPPGVPEGLDPAKAAALADYCLALLNSNEFLYVR